MIILKDIKFFTISLFLLQLIESYFVFCMKNRFLFMYYRNKHKTFFRVLFVLTYPWK